MSKPELLGTTFAILVLLIGILVGKALDLLDPWVVAVGVGISIIIVLGISAIVWIFGRTTHQAELKSIIQELRDVTSSARYSWLYTTAEVNEFESKCRCSNIWVVSPDLSNDTGSSAADIIAVVKKNLRRGITYTYIVPDSEAIDAVLPNLRQTFMSHPEQLRLVRLPQDTFRLLTTAHITMYNPNMEDNRVPDVFIELPIEQRGHGRGYWVKVANDAALGFVGRFRRIVETATSEVHQEMA